MIKRFLQKLATTLSLSAMLMVPTLATVHAQTDIEQGLCDGANLSVQSSGGTCANDTVAEQRVDNIIKLVINIFSLVVGVVSVIMIIVGGLKYITSGGDSGNITGAKNTILYAIIGLVVVALAQVVVRFVLSRTVA